MASACENNSWWEQVGQAESVEKNMEIGKVTTVLTKKHSGEGFILEVPQGVELSPGHENNSWWEGVGQAEPVEKS